MAKRKEEMPEGRVTNSSRGMVHLSVASTTNTATMNDATIVSQKKSVAMDKKPSTGASETVTKSVAMADTSVNMDGTTAASKDRSVTDVRKEWDDLDLDLNLGALESDDGIFATRDIPNERTGR